MEYRAIKMNNEFNYFKRFQVSHTDLQFMQVQVLRTVGIQAPLKMVEDISVVLLKDLLSSFTVEIITNLLATPKGYVLMEDGQEKYLFANVSNIS